MTKTGRYKNKQYQKEYRKTEKGKMSIKRYNKSKRGKAAQTKYKTSDKGKIKCRKLQSIFQSTQKGKIIRAKGKARRKNFGFHPISFPLDAPFDWHHVNKNDVVAIQRDIHRAINHICGDGKLEGVVG